MPAPSRATCVVAIANPQAGVGKTTVAINLAASLFKQGHTCLMVDLDHDAQATRALGVNLKASTHSAYSVMRGLSRFAESYIPTLAGIDLLPGNLDLVLLETPAIAATSSLRPLLDSPDVVMRYDYIMLDCPSALSPRVQDALAVADEVLVPFRVDGDELPPYEVLATLAQVLPGLSMHPVANMVRSQAAWRSVSSQGFGVVRVNAWVHIHYSPKLLTRPRHGLPAVVRWPADVIAQDFEHLASRLCPSSTPLPL